MKWRTLFAERDDGPLRWPLLLLLAALAPVLAASVHSLVVMKFGFRLYNAELWVLFVSHEYSGWRWAIVGSILTRTALTLAFLWGVSKYALPGVTETGKRWVAWLFCVLVWTLFAFEAEIAIK